MNKYSLSILILILLPNQALTQSQVRYLATNEYVLSDLKNDNHSRAVIRDLRNLARLGNHKAEYNLGVAYQVRGDERRAALWYRRAALFRHPLASYNLALMHYHGDGVDRDLTQAYRWMEVSAKADFPLAQLQLALMIYRGEGAVRDPDAEAYWYRRAAFNGEPEAQYNLAVLYSVGEGVNADPARAYAWMELAGEHGMSVDTELNLLSAAMTREQKDQITRLKRELSQQIRKRG